MKLTDKEEQELAEVERRLTELDECINRGWKSRLFCMLILIAFWLIGSLLGMLLIFMSSIFSII